VKLFFIKLHGSLVLAWCMGKMLHGQARAAWRLFIAGVVGLWSI
jgi:hypothetical protein